MNCSLNLTHIYFVVESFSNSQNSECSIFLNFFVQLAQKFGGGSQIFYVTCGVRKPVPVAARSNAWVCGRSPAEIAGSNPTGAMDVCLL